MVTKSLTIYIFCDWFAYHFKSSFNTIWKKRFEDYKIHNRETSEITRKKFTKIVKSEKKVHFTTHYPSILHPTNLLKNFLNFMKWSTSPTNVQLCSSQVDKGKLNFVKEFMKLFCLSLLNEYNKMCFHFDWKKKKELIS